MPDAFTRFIVGYFGLTGNRLVRMHSAKCGALEVFITTLIINQRYLGNIEIVTC